MKFSKLTLFIGIFFSMCNIFAQKPMLPLELKVGTPRYISSPDNKWIKSHESWQEYVMYQIKNNNFGNFTQTVWTAYSDRESNRTYTAPGGATSSAAEYKKLGFMQKVYIAEIKNGYAHIFEDDYTPVYPKINQTAKSLGWISVDNLLLWEKCPMNENNIFQKALVVGDPAKSTNLKQNPPFIKAPSKLGTSEFTAKSLDILFIMKKIGDYYLLSKEMNIRSRAHEVYGWLSNEYITFWDQRLCIEPTSISENVNYYKNNNYYPSIYKEVSGANSFHQENATGKPFWKYVQLSTERRSARVMRSPILSKYSNDVYKVAAYESLSGESENLMGDMIDNIEQAKEAGKTVNVIFVIAATSTMKNYYQPVAHALEDVMNRSFDINKVKAGVVLYKTPTDGDEEIQYQKCGDIRTAINFINKATAYSKGKTDYASVYKGLETALDTRKMSYQSEHSNFIILIGDAANEQKADAVHTISQKMKENRINFLAFQVNNVSGNKAYDYFALNVGDIVQKTADLRTPKIDGKKDYEFKRQKNRMYLTERVNKDRSDINTLIFSGYLYADAGKSENIEGLKKLLIENVAEYIKSVEDRIVFVSKSESGVVVDEVALREILMDLDWKTADINTYIEELKKGGVTKLTGYAPIKVKSAGNKQIFDFMLFFTIDELENLVSSLKQLNRSNTNDRKAYQDALITMGMAILGQMTKEDILEMSMEDMVNQIYGVPIELKSCGEVKIMDIITPDRVSDRKLQEIKEQFNVKLDDLERIKNNSKYSGRFITNGVTYLWVPLSAMPGYCQ